MAVTLNETPSANRLHIGIFGKTKQRKIFIYQCVFRTESIYCSRCCGNYYGSCIQGYGNLPSRPCVLIDTAGFDDKGELGALRIEKTELAAQKTDLAIILFCEEEMSQELKWYRYFKEKNTPVVPVLNKTDLYTQEEKEKLAHLIQRNTKEEVCLISAKTGEGIRNLKELLARSIPEGYGNRMITGDLVDTGDLVLLVMPQDIQAPKGRLILPQVQTLRELLDKKCLVMSVTTDQYLLALENLAVPPKLIITDSQVFFLCI
mgnify:CR=1 FL=1